MAPPIIELRAVTRCYGLGRQRRAVLEQLSAEFHAGEAVVIVGRSGAGKSTLLNLLGGIDQPDSGEIWLDGQNMAAMNEETRTRFRRQRIGFVFQFFNLIPTLTVRENLLLRPSLAGHEPAGPAAQADRLLSRVGLVDRGQSYPDELSGGEQQRVAVAAALTHHPKLVIADEPTGNLDADTAHEVTSLLIELVREQGALLVAATHGSELQAAADHVLELGAGSLQSRTQS